MHLHPFHIKLVWRLSEFAFFVRFTSVAALFVFKKGNGHFLSTGFWYNINEGGMTMKPNLKKTIIVHILRILYNYTSFDYPATQTNIVNYLNDIGIACTRKTVGRNLKYLVDSGLPIKRKCCKNGGYYYDFENDRFFVRTKLYDEKRS